MFWIGMLAGYFLGFVLAWILLNAIRGWDMQDSYCTPGAGAIPPIGRGQP